MRNARERLVRHVRELERLEEEKRAAADALRDAFRAARDAGYDVGTLRVVLRLRRMTPAERQEKRALEAIYMAALGMLEGDPLPDEARRRLDDEGEPKAPPGEAPEQESDREQRAPPTEPPPGQLPMQLKDPGEARTEGSAAAAAGKRIYDNPYPAGDPCRAAWDEGWCAKKKSHGMETPAAYQRRTKKPDAGEDADEKGAS